ncbi:LANO_0F03136g1_1 [Lachancea nothofagi CBS 11611]|uniref:Glutathione hydrolase n=1 Tax=Lachancea nothofagi CBS 11611 TaxID=1266666 RepID=A0A1G4K724_9SACH|nr:LANO_0F03136g1_1 [Lachancea nothofagi CBS 11611]
MVALRNLLVVFPLVSMTSCMQHYFVQSSDHNIDIKPLPRQPTLNPNSSQVLRTGRSGAISSDSEFCSSIAVEKVLKKFENANAADAAVTVALCLGMKNFFSSGIGGGGYAVFVGGNKQEKRLDPLFLDFREQAPELAHKDMFAQTPNASQVGGLAVGIPGELKGLYELYSQRGSGHVQWHELLEPIIHLGTKGWPVDEITALVLKMYEPYFVEHRHDWKFVLNSAGNETLKIGDNLKRTALAQTLREIAQNGTAAPFYDPNHRIGKALVNKVQKSGGILTDHDLEAYYVNISQPLSTKIRAGWANVPNNDLEVFTSSGSSSGAALVSALKILDHFPSLSGGDYIPEQTYVLIECMKYMSSARSRLGDYSQQDKLPDRVEEVLNSDWIESAVKTIKENMDSLQTLSNWTDYHPMYEMTDPHGTTHFSVVDKFNNAVSLTSTVNLLFGSLVHDTETGILLNNQMDDFSQPHRSNAFGLAPSKYNFAEPGKRPLSSSSPVIVLNELDQPDLVIGASGGSRITPSIFQVMTRLYWYNMPLLEAIAYPRVHHQLLPDQLEIESFGMLGKSTIDSLRLMGHDLVEQAPKSVVNGIKQSVGEWHAVSDFWRKRGISIAY